MFKKTAITSWKLLKETVQELTANDPLRMAGATAFFTTFALPPIIIIIVRTLGIFLNKEIVGRQLFQKLSAVLGKESADQILTTIRSFRALEQNWLVTALSFLFLLFVATTLFRVIKNSLNQLWDIRLDTRRRFKFSVTSRLHSIVIILLAGLLFLAVLLVDGIQAILGRYIIEIAPAAAYFVNTVVTEAVSILVVTIWFFVLFMYLPDGRPPRPIALAGALLTSVLFSIGKLLVHLLLSQNNIGTLYGTSGAMVFLLLFVFYSSLILYFGAAFTKVWGRHRKCPIEPLPHAAKYQLAKVSVKE